MRLRHILICKLKLVSKITNAYCMDMLPGIWLEYYSLYDVRALEFTNQE